MDRYYLVYGKGVCQVLFQAPSLDEAELRVIGEIEQLKKRLGYMLREHRRWIGLLRRTAAAKALRGSNTIEGVNVTLDDAIAAAAGQELLDADLATKLAVFGYREAMTYVLQMAKDEHFSYSLDSLKSLHYMMLSFDLGKDPGQLRQGEISVRNDQTGLVVYEGPSGDVVRQLTHELVESLNQQSAIPPLVRAAMAHLNLVMIHPFKDGNGRMARCLQSLVIARSGVLYPEFASIEEYLGSRANTQGYYDVLAEVGAGRWTPERDTRPWIRFCLTAHFRQARTVLRRTEMIERVWNDLEAQAKERKLPVRILYALADAAFGHKVRNATYRAIADISDSLASHDLMAAVKNGLLIARGERRGRHYVGSPIVESIRLANQTEKTIEDPFVAVQPRLPGF